MPDSTNWPGGWYVYEDGRVSGPLTAEDTFRLQSEAPSGKPRIVSRKGFSQWYALKDLSEIFRLTEEMGLKARSEMLTGQPAASLVVPSQAGTKALLIRKTIAQPDPASTTAASPAPITPAVDTPSFQTSDVVRPRNKASSTTPPQPIKHSANSPGTIHSQAGIHPTEPVTQANVAEVKTSSTKPDAAGALSKSLHKNAVTAQASLMQEYLIQRGRLKLGKLKNPWVFGFMGLPASLGALWFLWIRDLIQEINTHCRATSKQQPSTVVPHAALAIVPGFHVYVIWCLAKLIAEMEAQNRYQTVSPTTAAWLSLFPPFALAYLQNAVNNHWLLHVRHSMTSSASPATAAADEKTKITTAKPPTTTRSS